MAQSFFIWNGIDCRSKGIVLEGPVPIIRPEERVQHVTIPGRSGDLTILEDDRIFNSYIQTVSVHVKGAYRVNEVVNWLTGSGYVTFHGQPQMRQRARVIGAVTLEKHSRNIDWWDGTVQFYCEPMKELLSDSAVSIISSGASVRNGGDVPCRPLITVNATEAGKNMTITCGGKTLTINLSGMADTGCVVDCEAEIVTNYSGAANLTALSSGSFPVLAQGNNAITFTNVASLDFTRRERYL